MSNANSLYRNGAIYDAMNDSLIEDSHFYLEEFKNEKGKILELACGTGRITCALAKAGKDLSGLDISQTMLDQAKMKSKKLHLDIPWYLGSMINFEIEQKFDAIFVGYNSIHHILTNSDFQKFLGSVKKHLNPRGRFLFDIFNPSIAILNQHKMRSKMDDFIDPETKEPVFVTEENYYDSATQINHITYYYSKKGQPDYHSHPLEMRCYFPQEMEALLLLNGFKVIHKYGNFDRSKFQSSSQKQIFDCVLG